MKRTAFLFLAIFLSTWISAQAWEDTVARIEKVFSRYKSSSPGTQLAISRNNKLIFSKAWGMADLEHDASLTTQSVIEAGSVSKQFTAAAILLLEQEGKLSLNDDVRKYVPELPDYGKVITLRHMMQHTSGLKDWGSIASIAGWPRSTKTYNNDDALYIISRQKTLNHAPGDEYLYSNSNYNLFAIIVQRVSGMSLAEYTQKNIFAPAGMTRTEWRANFKKVVRNRAIAYQRAGSVYQTNMPNEYVYGNGGLLTTAEDLVKWNEYYTSGKLGQPSLLPKQIATSAYNNGSMGNYGAGIVTTKSRGWTLYTHDGATASYRANLDYFPELGLSIAWLTNTSEFDGDTLNIANAIRQLFIPNKTDAATPAALPTFTITPEKLNQYTGWYSNSRTGAGVRLYVDNGKLYGTQMGELKPVADNVFALGVNRLHMSAPGTESRYSGFVFVNASNDKIYFKAMEPAVTTREALDEYTGEYYSEEAEVKLILRIKGGKLEAQLQNSDIPLTPAYKDGFDSQQGAISFRRDDKKRIIGFNVSVGRARNVQFLRASGK